MMRGSPVWGALNSTVTRPSASLSWYSVRRRRRKIDSASGPFSHSRKRSCSASWPLFTRPTQIRVSSSADASDGTRPAYRTPRIERCYAAERQAHGTGRLRPGVYGRRGRRVAAAGDHQPRAQTEHGQEHDHHDRRRLDDARQQARTSEADREMQAEIGGAAERQTWQEHSQRDTRQAASGYDRGTHAGRQDSQADPEQASLADPGCDAVQALLGEAEALAVADHESACRAACQQELQRAAKRQR